MIGYDPDTESIYKFYETHLRHDCNNGDHIKNETSKYFT